VFSETIKAQSSWHVLASWAGGCDPKTIEVLLALEGYLAAGEFLPQDVVKELKQIADQTQKERGRPGPGT
jgi:hypothetical protein